MSWSKVGEFLKENSGKGVALIGSLLTGNVPGALSAGASLVASATGTDDPQKALTQLQSDPQVMIRLEELAVEEEKDIRRHLEAMLALELEDDQKAHEQTQMTIRNGDEQESNIRWVRPTHATLSLIAAIVYVFITESPQVTILGTLLTLPFTYAGLREVGKGIKAFKGVSNG